MIQIISFIIGSSIGSFLNVVIFRYGGEEGALSGRSRCLHCQHKLSWYELIPIFSFVWLKGKCAYCKKSISTQYLIVELISGLGFLGLSFLGLSLPIFIWSAILFAIALSIAIYDIKYLVLPDSFLAVFFVWLVLGNLLFWRDTIVISVLAGFILASFFLILFLVSKGKWIGGGDIKLGALLGFWLGWPGIVVMFMITYISGALIGLTLLFLKKVKKQSQLPFAPFMLIASFIVFLWGQEILNWYINLIL
jgi:leader peptidase (prepilin peptidase)/N-methyltransferase